ncbi:MAG: tetratricopeptide repeat protein [Treponema sp.]|nr:tetratricopeptide repeat protein [Treponema sp.]
MINKNFSYIIIFFIILSLSSFNYGCSSMAASAEEYYSIGMAYFELGKYEEAERWLNRAKTADRTMTASQYNLGRLAFERQRYREAAEYFEDILKRDPNNVLSLRAAAYTRIKTGDIGIADKHYKKLLELVPESIDDGYNHALVLYAMKRYGEAEETLYKYPAALEERDSLLLYSRSQKAQNKPEAIDNYAKWLGVNSDSSVRYEYAQLLEQHELYARALEEYRKLLSQAASSNTEPPRSALRYSIAKLLLIADYESSEGITEMETAVSEGFIDTEALEVLLNSGKVSPDNMDSLRLIIHNIQRGGTEQNQETANEQGQDTRSESSASSETGTEGNPGAP